MSKLRSAGLGPIVGDTTNGSCRIWVRSDATALDSDHADANRRTVGVIGIIRVANKTLNPMPCYYFRLHREFDRSGSINLGVDTPESDNSEPLQADTEYTVRVGILVLDDPDDENEEFESSELLKVLPPARVWRNDLKSLPPEKCEAVFSTFPDSNSDSGKVGFLLGSCRYPGLLWKIRHSDRIFKPMAERAQADQNQPRFVLMVGDQIYADLLNRTIPIGRADTYQEFRERYLAAYGSRHMRNLMRRLPTYMILDDHEIEDNWSQDRIRRDAKYQLFTIAIDAYLSYQWSHGPRTYGKRLYYRFDYGSYPFFVLDTRTQRYLEGDKGDLTHNHMLGRPTHPTATPGQLQRLLAWLEEQQSNRGNVPKFIVTSSVFVPSPMHAREPLGDFSKENSDSWPGFPNTKSAILQCIVEKQIQNVVFLSGDIHCSNCAQIRFKGTNAAKVLKAFSVTSSAFYWPFPFADGEPSDYVHDSTAKGQEDSFVFKTSDGSKITMDYKAWNFTQEDNFCHLTADRNTSRLNIKVFDKDGNTVIEESPDGQGVRLDTDLQLEPW